MANVRLPNGRVVNNIPDTFTKQDIQAFALKNNLATEEDFTALPLSDSLTVPAVVEEDLKKKKLEEDIGRPMSEVTKDVASTDNDFIVDQAKAGASDLLFSIVPDFIMQGMLDVNPLDPKYKLADNTTDVKSFNVDYEAAKQEVRQNVFSYKGIKPTSELERLGGGAVRSVVGEGPMAIAGAKSKIGAAGELIHSLTAALAGQTSSEAVYDLAVNSFGAGEQSAKIAAALAGAVAGASTSVARIPVTAAGHYASKAKDTYTNFSTEKARITNGLEQADSYLKDTQLRGVIDAATTAQPDMMSVIKAAKDIEDLIPNLSIAPAAILADNPIYRYNADKLIKTNPEFRAKLEKSLKETKAAIDARRFTLFGETGSNLSQKARASVPDNYSIDLRNAKKRIDAIDGKLEAVSSRISSSRDSTDVGIAVRNLMKAKEHAVKSRLQPEYSRILNKATEEGLRFPKESVQAVHDNIKLLKAEDVFATFPTLARQVKERWSPIPIFRNGVKVGETFRNVKITEMDSFKRALSKARRKTTDPDVNRKLEDIQKTFFKEVRNLPSDFSAAYRDLDLQYYKELGIPFGSVGAKQLSAARFQTQVGEHLSKPEQARDFLTVVGESGIPVVKDAILIKMASSNVLTKDGIVDPVNLKRFVDRNKRLIDTVPRFSEELSDVRTMMQRLPQQKARMDAEYNIAAKRLADGFYKGVHNKYLSDIAADILKSPATSDKYFADVRNFEPSTSKMLRQGVRAELIERSLKADGSVSDFIFKNKSTFDQWFGPTYMKDVQALADASDLLQKFDLRRMRFAIDFKNDDAFSKATNMPFSEWVSLARDRLTGPLVKMSIAASKIKTRGVAKSRDSELAELLLQPEKLAQLGADLNKIKAPDITKLKGTLVEDLSALSGKLASIMGRGIYFGDVGSEAGIGFEESLNAPQQVQPIPPLRQNTTQPQAPLINGLPAAVQNPMGMLNNQQPQQ